MFVKGIGRQTAKWRVLFIVYYIQRDLEKMWIVNELMLQWIGLYSEWVKVNVFAIFNWLYYIEIYKKIVSINI